jgi:rubrerythrin
MNELNFDSMTRDELAHYMVSHRNTPEAAEATRALIRQMAKRAESRGIDFYRSQSQTASRETIQSQSIKPSASQEL